MVDIMRGKAMELRHRADHTLGWVRISIYAPFFSVAYVAKEWSFQ